MNIDSFFLEKYIEFHNKQIKSDPRFPQMLGMVAIGFSLGRRNGYIVSPAPVFPNFYILLVGPSTLSHKSSSVNHVFFRIIERTYRAPFHFSAESFYDYLSQNSKAVLYFDEFGSILKKMVRKNSYMAGFADDLNSFYGCPDELMIQLKTLKTRQNPSGILYLSNIFLTVIGCTTAEALEENLDPELLQGGLFPRFLIVNTEFCDYFPRHEKTEAELQEEHRAIADMREYLNKIGDMSFQFVWTTDAQTRLGDYMRTTLDTLRNNGGMGNAAIIGRAEESIIRIANIFAVNETQIPDNFARGRKFAVRITREIVDKTITFVQQSVNDAIEIKEFVSLSHILSILRKQISKIKGPISHSKLLRHSNLIAEEFKKGIDTMIQTMSIRPFTYNDYSYYCTPILKPECENCQMRTECNIDELTMRILAIKQAEEGAIVEEEEEVAKKEDVVAIPTEQKENHTEGQSQLEEKEKEKGVDYKSGKLV